MNTTIRSNPRAFLSVAVFLVLWALLVKDLSVYWSVIPQYSYGWFVPLLCVFIFFTSWLTRPAASKAGPVAPWIFYITGFALLPTWLIEQPNPDWRLVSWFLALEVVILSLCGVYFAGGRPWLRHFAFPICFILTAVPWPFGIEWFVTETLMHTAAAITVAALNIFDIPALQLGNVIEVKSGLLGIDEACSGIRSLQATVMISLFLGELYRTPWRRRIFLLLAGLVVAFLCNLGRAFLLAFVAAHEDVKAVAKWHDPAGFTILAICFLVLWGMAALISGRSGSLQRTRVMGFPSLPAKPMIALGFWLAVTILGSEIWYRIHENHDKEKWSFAWPAHKEHFSDIEIPPNATDLLRFDSGRAASWSDGDGSQWTAFFFKWVAGPSRSRILARGHRPEVCLPAAGNKLQADRGIITIQVKNITIPFHVLEFNSGGQRIDVFFCFWQDGSRQAEQYAVRTDWNRMEGLESVLLGERNLGQQTLEIVVAGSPTAEEAEASLRRQAESLIHVDG